MTLSRRTLLRNTLIGGVVLGTGSWFAIPVDQVEPSAGEGYAFLSADDLLILHMLLPIFLATSGYRARHEQQVLQNIDRAVGVLPQASQAELRQLFELLANRLGRVLFAGFWSRWREATPRQLSRMLDHWRHSTLDLLQVAYQGLHQLILASYYAESFSWPPTGYPGPPELEDLSA